MSPENFVPYSRKIWRELNLVDCPKPARTKTLADFILADDQARPRHAPAPRFGLTHALQLDAIRRVRATWSVN